jgi:hypothetical protein
MTFTTLSFSSPVTILSAQCFGYELISETERLQILPDQGRIVPEINRSGIHTKFLQGRRPLRGLTDSFLTLFLGFKPARRIKPRFGYPRLWARLALKQLPHKIGRPSCGLKGTVSGLPHWSQTISNRSRSDPPPLPCLGPPKFARRASRQGLHLFG